MKRDQNNKIVIERLEQYEFLNHDLTEYLSNFEDKWNCLYEQVKVFTDQNTSLTAFKYCNYGYLTCFDKANDLPTSRMQLLPNHEHLRQISKKINEQFNAYQNCLGFCILDGDYWLNLTAENINIILKDDKYVEVNEYFIGNHIVIYYNDKLPVHIGKYNSDKGQFEHKIGCNFHSFVESADASSVYQYNKIIRYKKEENNF